MAKQLFSPALALLGIGAVILSCSDAPLVLQQANRIVLVELFSTPPDE
ncbi:MAG: hypothetical protein ABIK44_01935 [candidate division WOR-3 bacterium]